MRSSLWNPWYMHPRLLERVQRQVSDRYGPLLAEIRSEAIRKLQSSGYLFQNPLLLHKDFLSTLDDTIRIDVTARLIDPSPFGTFSRTQPSAAFIVGINCFVIESNAPNRKMKSFQGLDDEQEGWARSLLGDTWSDYAYRIDSFSGLTGARPVFFPVFVDFDAIPHLAPSDFRWRAIGAGGPVQRRKLVPNRSNRPLIQYLRSNGDLVDIEEIESPQEEPDSVWGSIFSSALIQRITITARFNESTTRPNTPISIESFAYDRDLFVSIIRVTNSQVDKTPRRVGLRVEIDRWRKRMESHSADRRATTAAHRIPIDPFPAVTDMEADEDGIVWLSFPASGEGMPAESDGSD